MAAKAKPKGLASHSSSVDDAMQSEHALTEIPKIDAARRQLDEAIRLWMEGRDALATHTLTMAALGVLYDIAKHQNLLKEGDPLLLYLSRKGQKKFRALTNFLKHADKDPQASCREPAIEEHEYRIGFTLLLYRKIVGDLTPEMGAFHLTMIMTRPELFRVAPDPDPDIEAGAQYGAELLRNSWGKRRRMAKVMLRSINSGALPANASLQRLSVVQPE